MITVAREPFAKMWDEAWPLIQEHQKMVGASVSKDLYVHSERIGLALIYVARDDGDIVGYVAFGTAPSHHTGVFTAMGEALYVKPSHRGINLAHRLLSHARQDLTHDVGVQEILISMPYCDDKADLFDSLDFEKHEVTYRWQR